MYSPQAILFIHHANDMYGADISLLHFCAPWTGEVLSDSDFSVGYDHRHVVFGA